ncbi:MAG: monovalent cation/H+ antiporter complex subunit F [Dehalococcoidales bacterium]|jgi:multicomponent Na+:H+ antiporter subunit F|nr:monovalent cation/H+ antiporter complex subunit F [Dehalococcoidales bacterium]
MEGFIVFAAFFILALNVVCFYRVIKGPNVFDRALAISVIGNNTVLILVLVGFIFKRIDMFFDIAVVYALLNFILSIALGKYFENRGKQT